MHLRRRGRPRPTARTRTTNPTDSTPARRSSCLHRCPWPGWPNTRAPSMYQAGKVTAAATPVRASPVRPVRASPVRPRFRDQRVPFRRIALGRRRDQPPRGPVTSRSSPSRPTVRLASVGPSGSMIGNVRRRRPLVGFVTRPPRPGQIWRETCSSPRSRSTSLTRRPEISLIRSAVVARMRQPRRTTGARRPR
jgi:hypothetical protein